MAGDSGLTKNVKPKSTNSTQTVPTTPAPVSPPPVNETGYTQPQNLTSPTTAAIKGTYNQNINTTPADDKRVKLTDSMVKDQYQAILGRQPTQAEINQVLQNTLYVDQLQYNLNQLKGTQNTSNTNTPTSPDGTYSPQDVLKNTSSVYKNTLTDKVPTINADTAGTNITAPQINNIAPVSASTATAAQAQFQSAGNAATAGNVTAKPVATYDAQTTIDQIMQSGQMQAAQGEINPDHLITPEQYDVEGLYTGVNKDGTTNWAGQALNEWAEQNLDEVDDRATMRGQLQLLQEEFTGPNGEPKIPAWAAATARSVGRIAAFNGVTGTAATAAMSQALLEASLPIAQQDANLYATLTLQNLNNKQASILNKANVLAKFELTNLDNRMLAAVENSKAFLQMDLQNLANEQQAAVINTQARVQSILEDAKAINTQRLFTAQSTNEQNRFYDELNANIDMYNTSQINGMKQFNSAQQNQVNIANAQMQTATSQFNAAQLNSVKMFNANLEMQQDQFYKTMQYNVDLANARWRQTVTLTNAQMQFDAAAMDVKNQFDLSQEALNRIWDRSDQLLNYAWQSSENSLERNARIALAQLNGDIQADIADQQGIGSIIGTIVGAGAGSFFKDFDWDIF